MPTLAPIPKRWRGVCGRCRRGGRGSRHQGHDAIRAWWVAAKAKYSHVAEPVDVTRVADRIVVTARVSGRFPNSPAMLDYAFTLENGLIAAVRIG